MPFSSMITTASRGSTCPIVQYARRTYSRVVWPATKCHAVTRFIGIAIASSLATTRVVPCARKRRKLLMIWKKRGTPWLSRSHCSRCRPTWRGRWIYFVMIARRSVSINAGTSWECNVRSVIVLTLPLRGRY